MTLEEIRALVAGTSGTEWHILSGDAPTYLNRFIYVQSGNAHYLAAAEHESRAALKADLDVGLAWGLRDPSTEDGPTATEWSRSLRAPEVWGHVVEVLYRGQPVDRVVYAIIEDNHGLVPWPTPRYPGDAAADPHAAPVWEVSHWELDLVLLLKELGVTVGTETVESYLRRCAIAVVE